MLIALSIKKKPRDLSDAGFAFSFALPVGYPRILPWRGRRRSPDSSTTRGARAVGRPLLRGASVIAAMMLHARPGVNCQVVVFARIVARDTKCGAYCPFRRR